MKHWRVVIFCIVGLAVCLCAGSALAGDGPVAYAVDGGNIYFSPDTGAIVAADQTVTGAVIPGRIGGVTVTAVGSKAFYQCKALEGVRFPDSVTKIDEFAFSGCASLKEIRLPARLETMSTGAFSDCTAAESLWIPASLTTVWGGYNSAEVFEGCSSMQTVTFETGIRQIPGNLFADYDWLESMVIPDTVAKIGSRAFFRCKSLREVTLPAGLETIGDRAFANCPVLKRVVFLGAVPAFDPDVFAGADPEIDFLSVTDGAYALTVRAVDAQTLAPLKNAAVRVYGAAGELVASGAADSGGACPFYLAEGEYSLSVSASGGYKARTALWTAGVDGELTIGLTKTDLVKVEFTQHEMTADEIAAVGIDAQAEGNQQVFAYEISLEYSAHLTLPFKAYVNGTHQVKLSTADGAAVDWGEPLEVQAPFEGSGVFESSENARQTVRIYPITEQFFLVVWGRDTWLKEMFHVQMLVLNQSQTDTLVDCVCSLSLPDGLSLAQMEGDRQALNFGLGTVAPGSSAMVDWYVRGDEEGSYLLAASLSGVFMPLREPFAYEYICGEPIHVLAGSALQLTLSIPSAAYNGQGYPMVLELKNTSDKPLYNVTHQITAVGEWQRVATDLSMREMREEELFYETMDGKASITVAELKPGESVYVEMSVPIKFSSILESISGFGGGISARMGVADLLAGGEVIAAGGGAVLAAKIVAKVLSLIKVEYLFESGVVTTLDGSTAEIPVTIQVLPADQGYLTRKRYVNKALDKMVELAFGGLDSKAAELAGKIVNIYMTGEVTKDNVIRAATGYDAQTEGEYSEVPVSIGESVGYFLHIPQGKAIVRVGSGTELWPSASKRSLLPQASAAENVRARVVVKPLAGATVSIVGDTAAVTGGDAEIVMVMLGEGDAYMAVEREDALSVIKLTTSPGVCAEQEAAERLDLDTLASPRITLTSQTGEFTVSRALMLALLGEDDGSLALETPEQTVVMQWYSMLTLDLLMAEADSLRFTLARDGGTISLQCAAPDGKAIPVEFPGDAYLIFTVSGGEAYALPNDALREGGWAAVPVSQTGTLVTAQLETMTIQNKIGIAGLGGLAVLGIVWLFRRRRRRK